MTKNTFLSEFEQRIKTYQLVKKNKLIAKIISFCLVLGLIVVYFLTPISKVNTSKISGNINYTPEQILQIANLSNKDSLYLISTKNIENKLKECPLIKNESVDVKLSPLGLSISLEEIVPVLEYGNEIYMSDGNTLDLELLKSKNPLIGDHLFVEKNNLVQLYSKPYEDKFVKTRVEHLSKLILSLSEEERALIDGVNYDSSTYYYSFYYSRNENEMLKVVFDSAKKVDDLNIIISKEKIDKYLSYLDDDKTKDKFVEFEEEINGKKMKIKSVKIVMQTIEGELYYHVKYNNPLTNNDYIE